LAGEQAQLGDERLRLAAAEAQVEEAREDLALAMGVWGDDAMLESRNIGTRRATGRRLA
jgi:hypothetical protein